jgi:hypothetical protein
MRDNHMNRKALALTKGLAGIVCMIALVSEACVTEAPDRSEENALLGATAAQSNLVAFVPYIRSTTWKTRDAAGQWCSDAAFADFEREASRMRNAGLNTVWIDDVAWAFFDPGATGTITQPAELACLKRKLTIARHNGLRGLIKINGAGNGFFPANATSLIGKRPGDQGLNIDYCTWYDHPAAYNAWYRFSVQLLRELREFHSSTYFIVYTEPGNTDIPEGTSYKRCEISQVRYAADVPKIQRTFGRYAIDLLATDAALRQGVALVFHDDGYINEGWAASSPIVGDAFDVVSGSAYASDHSNYQLLDFISNSEIVHVMEARLSRFLARSSKPFALLEFGSPQCRGSLDKEADQARVFGTVVDWALGRGIGWNYWSWTYDNDGCGDGRGYGVTYQPSLDKIRRNNRGKAAIMEVLAAKLAWQFRFDRTPRFQLSVASVDPSVSTGTPSSYTVGCDFDTNAGCIVAKIGTANCTWLGWNTTFSTLGYFKCPAAPAGTPLTCGTVNNGYAHARCQSAGEGSDILVGRAR